MLTDGISNVLLLLLVCVCVCVCVMPLLVVLLVSDAVQVISDWSVDRENVGA